MIYQQQALTNGVQHGGVLLSDLADRSPSAGSITAASLCNFVSYGNQRCTNLVTYKGKRYGSTMYMSYSSVLIGTVKVSFRVKMHS